MPAAACCRTVGSPATRAKIDGENAIRDLTRTLAGLAALIGASAAHAEVYNCRNPDLEVMCADGRCSAAVDDGFTPMSVAFNDDGDLSVCAYSGCWDGRGEVARHGSFLGIFAHALPFTPAIDGDERREDIAILLDRSDRVALLKLDGFAQPLLCAPLQP